MSCFLAIKMRIFVWNSKHESRDQSTVSLLDRAYTTILLSSDQDFDSLLDLHRRVLCSGDESDVLRDSAAFDLQQYASHAGTVSEPTRSIDGEHVRVSVRSRGQRSANTRSCSQERLVPHRLRGQREQRKSLVTSHCCSACFFSSGQSMSIAFELAIKPSKPYTSTRARVFSHSLLKLASNSRSPSYYYSFDELGTFIVGGTDWNPSFRGFISHMDIYRRTALSYEQVRITPTSGAVTDTSTAFLAS